MSSHVSRELFATEPIDGAFSDDSGTQSLHQAPAPIPASVPADIPSVIPALLERAQSFNVPGELVAPSVTQPCVARALENPKSLRQILDMSCDWRPQRCCVVVRLLHYHVSSAVCAEMFVTDHSISTAVVGMTHICVTVRNAMLIRLLGVAFTVGDVIYIRDMEVFRDENRICMCSADAITRLEQTRVAVNGTTVGLRPVEQPYTLVHNDVVLVRSCDGLLLQRVSTTPFRYSPLTSVVHLLAQLVTVQARLTDVTATNDKLWYASCPSCKRAVSLCQLTSGYVISLKVW